MREARAWRLAIARLLAGALLPPYSLRRVRAMIYRIGGIRISPGAEVCGQVVFMHHNVSIGGGAFIGACCSFVTSRDAAITIGERAALGPHVRLIAVTHEVGTSMKRAGRPVSADISVGDGAWIGASSIVLPGVTIGRGAVVAAGAVVTGDVPTDVVVAGVPARPVRSLD